MGGAGVFSVVIFFGGQCVGVVLRWFWVVLRWCWGGVGEGWVGMG